MNAEFAWAAGLFEGEGCLHVNRRPSGKYQVQMVLAMTDRDIVERFAEIMGCGSVQQTPPRAEGQKPLYRWSTYTAADIDALISLLLPWFGERRRTKALEVQAASRSMIPHNSEKTHCPRGHRLEGDNLKLEKVYNANGKTYIGRRCVTCHRDRAAERKLRAKEAA